MRTRQRSQRANRLGNREESPLWWWLGFRRRKKLKSAVCWAEFVWNSHYCCTLIRRGYIRLGLIFLLFLGEASSPGRDRSPGGSLSVLVKLLCSLLQSCKMSPPECSLSSGSTSKISIKWMLSVKRRKSKSKWENSPSSGDRDSATSSVAVAWKKKGKRVFRDRPRQRRWLTASWWRVALHLWGRGCWRASCVVEHQTSQRAFLHLPPGWVRTETWGCCHRGKTGLRNSFHLVLN